MVPPASITDQLPWHLPFEPQTHATPASSHNTWIKTWTKGDAIVICGWEADRWNLPVNRFSSGLERRISNNMRLVEKQSDWQPVIVVVGEGAEAFGLRKMKEDGTFADKQNHCC